MSTKNEHVIATIKTFYVQAQCESFVSINDIMYAKHFVHVHFAFILSF